MHSDRILVWICMPLGSQPSRCLHCWAWHPQPRLPISLHSQCLTSLASVPPEHVQQPLAQTAAQLFHHPANNWLVDQTFTHFMCNVLYWNPISWPNHHHPWISSRWLNGWFLKQEVSGRSGNIDVLAMSINLFFFDDLAQDLLTCCFSAKDLLTFCFSDVCCRGVILLTCLVFSGDWVEELKASLFDGCRTGVIKSAVSMAEGLV